MKKSDDHGLMGVMAIFLVIVIIVAGFVGIQYYRYKTCAEGKDVVALPLASEAGTVSFVEGLGVEEASFSLLHPTGKETSAPWGSHSVRIEMWRPKGPEHMIGSEADLYVEKLADASYRVDDGFVAGTAGTFIFKLPAADVNMEHGTNLVFVLTINGEQVEREGYYLTIVAEDDQLTREWHKW